MASCFNNTIVQRTICTGQPQREAEDVVLPDFWWFSVDLMQEQRVTGSISGPSLVRKVHLPLSTVPEVQTGSNDHSLVKLPILKISTKWVLEIVTGVRRRTSKLEKSQSHPYFYLF